MKFLRLIDCSFKDCAVYLPIQPVHLLMYPFLLSAFSINLCTCSLNCLVCMVTSARISLLILHAFHFLTTHNTSILIFVLNNDCKFITALQAIHKIRQRQLAVLNSCNAVYHAERSAQQNTTLRVIRSVASMKQNRG